MKHAVVFLAVVAAAGLAEMRGDDPAPPPAAKAVAKAPDGPAVKFSPNPVPLAGVSPDVHAVAATADGKLVAAAGGSSNPTAGFITIFDAATKKELLSVPTRQVVNAVAFSPDGRRLAYSDLGGKAGVLDTATGKTAVSLKIGDAARVALGPDGKVLATVTAAKAVQLWNAATGDELRKLEGATARLSNVAFSPDGKRVAACGVENPPNSPTLGKVFVWDAATGKFLHQIENGNGPVLAVVFSPDGAAIAAAGSTAEVHLYDAATGAETGTIPIPSGPVNGLAFAPGGKTLAGALSDGSVRFWDVAAKAETSRLPAHPGSCRAVAFTAGGKWLVSGGGRRSVKVWDAAAKSEFATLREDPRPEPMPTPTAFAAAADGSVVAVATEERDVRLLDGKAGRPLRTLRGHDDVIAALAFSPDGKTLASASADRTTRLWDVGSGKELTVLRGHENWVYAVAFSPDGRTLATGAYDHTVRLWDRSGAVIATIPDAHRGSVRAVAFSRDGRTLATGGSDRIVRLWDTSTRASKATLKGHGAPVRAVAFAPDGTPASAAEDGTVRLWVTGGKGPTVLQDQDGRGPTEFVGLTFAGPRTLAAVAADGILRVWDTQTGERSGRMVAHTDGVTGIAAVPGGLLTTGHDRDVKRWRHADPGPVRLFTGHTGTVQSAHFSADGKRLVTCGQWPEGDKTLRVWDVATGNQQLKIDHPSQAAMAVFSPDGSLILSAGVDANAYLWDAATGKPVRTLRGHAPGWLYGVAYSADGKRVMTCGADKTVRVWDPATGREVGKFTGHTAAVRRVAFHPDGKHALSAGRDSFVRMWELESGKEVRTFKSSGEWANCLALTRDGKYVTTGGKSMRIWEVATGKLVRECVDAHPNGATAADFSPDGRILLSSGTGGTARLWDMATGRELYRFDHKENLYAVAFSPDGKTLVTGGGGVNSNGKWTKGTDHVVRLWALPDERMTAEYNPGR
jgi:WD40 repeat protein